MPRLPDQIDAPMTPRQLVTLRSLSAEASLRLGKLCGNGPELWLNLQKRYDLHHAQQGSEK